VAERELEASYGYKVGVPQTQTSYTWTRNMVPGGTYSFVMWAGDAKGRESKKSNTVTVTLPVHTTPPAAPVVSVTGTSASTVGLAEQIGRRRRPAVRDPLRGVRERRL